MIIEHGVSNGQHWSEVVFAFKGITGKDVRCAPENRDKRPLVLEVVGGNDNDFEELVWARGNMRRVG